MNSTGLLLFMLLVLVSYIRVCIPNGWLGIEVIHCSRASSFSVWRRLLTAAGRLCGGLQPLMHPTTRAGCAPAYLCP